MDVLHISRISCSSARSDPLQDLHLASKKGREEMSESATDRLRSHGSFVCGMVLLLLFLFVGGITVNYYFAKRRLRRWRGKRG